MPYILKRGLYFDIDGEVVFVSPGNPLPDNSNDDFTEDKLQMMVARKWIVWEDEEKDKPKSQSKKKGGKRLILKKED